MGEPIPPYVSGWLRESIPPYLHGCVVESILYLYEWVNTTLLIWVGQHHRTLLGGRVGNLRFKVQNTFLCYISYVSDEEKSFVLLFYEYKRATRNNQTSLPSPGFILWRCVCIATYVCSISTRFSLNLSAKSYRFSKYTPNLTRLVKVSLRYPNGWIFKQIKIFCNPWGRRGCCDVENCIDFMYSKQTELLHSIFMYTLRKKEKRSQNE